MNKETKEKILADAIRPALIEKHKENCLAVLNERPWAFLPLTESYTLFGEEHRGHYKGSRSGRPHKKGQYRWFLILCNDPACPAKIRVPEEWILAQLTTLNAQESEGTTEQLWKFRDKWMWYIAVKYRMKFLDDVYALVYGNANTEEDANELMTLREVKDKFFPNFTWKELREQNEGWEAYAKVAGLKPQHPCPECGEEMERKTVQVDGTKSGFESVDKCPSCGRTE